MQANRVKVIECPRDAMQGMEKYIPVTAKSEYINSLLKAGFDTIDFGSFVSAKAIPQLRDTAEVLSKLDLNNTSSKLLAIIANKRGAECACRYGEIAYLGFPFSISETFQKRNTNSTIKESLTRVMQIQELCAKHKKELVIYISMAFGNPYGDEWNKDVAIGWTEKLVKIIGIKIISLADTIGVSDPGNITYLFSNLTSEFPKVEFGAHLHTHPSTWKEKIEAAYSSGCRRFDSAVKGYGGCPMATDKLVGNMPTELIVDYFKQQNISSGIDDKKLAESQEMALKIF